MKVKRKVRIKVKNLIIFIIFILLTILSIVGTIYICIKAFSPSNDQEIEIEQKEKKPNKKQTKKEKKLEELDNINKKIDYFNEDYIDRYIKYKKNHKNLSNKQIVKDVNMNLDLNQYEDTKKARNLNTEKVLVNKHYFLEKDYVPDNLEEINTQYALEGMRLVSDAKDAFEEMAKKAKKEGLNIIVMSSYRSYKYQVNLYNRYARKDGKEKADTYSGRPGHSEHQTGFAIDVYNKKTEYTNFEKTKEYDWMLDHAHEYGFILRFPKDKENETGYQFESWHYRYVGKKAAKYIKDNSISFEEYYATKIKDW